MDSQGFQTRNRNISLSLNVANGLARLNSSGLIPTSLLPSTDGITEGTTNLYYTNARARAAISATGPLAYSSTTGVLSYNANIRRHAFTAPYDYCGTAPAGSAESAAVWTITRISVFSDGHTTTAMATGVSWTGRASATYS